MREEKKINKQKRTNKTNLTISNHWMNCLKIHQKSKLFYLINKFLYALKIGLEVNFYESPEAH
jgi:hypothetical protein